MSQKQFIPSPSGSLIFGYVEGCVIEERIVKGRAIRAITIEDGPVYLQQGHHRSFGQAHIWARHQDQLVRKGYHTIDDVAAYVAAILQPNTPVGHEGLASWENNKLFAIRGAVGFAVLKPINLAGGQTGYSVTTAYQKPRDGTSRVSRIVHR